MFKLMRKILGKIDGKKRNLPHVVFDDVDLEKKLSNLRMDCSTVSECLGVILSKLGYGSDDQILISDYKFISGPNDERIHYINCYRNMKLVEILGFKYECFFDEVPNLIVCTDMMERSKKEYDMSYDELDGVRKVNLDVLTRYEEYLDGNRYQRNYSPRKAVFKIGYGEYELLFEVYMSNDYFVSYDEDGNYVKFKLDNEEELVKYLVGLDFPVRIDEVYKKICEISLGDDVSNYHSIYLCVTKAREITDKIEVREGNCSSFGMTRNGRKIFINGNDSWNYEFIGEDVDDLLLDNEEGATVRFSMSSRNNDITYSVRANTDGEIDSYTNDLVMYDIKTARGEVENTKKLIRTVFNK